MCSFWWLSVAKNHDFGQILTFGRRLDRFILSPSGGEKPQFCHLFGFRHLVMSTVGGNLRKLNTGAQLQTFPYQTASKSFLFSNVLMAKSGEQTLTFKSVTDRQSVADKKTWRTDKKLNVFRSPPRRRVKSKPHQTWYGDRGPRARSCTSKTFGGLTHSFAARGTEHLGVTRPRHIKKTHNSITPWVNPTKLKLK